MKKLGIITAAAVLGGVLLVQPVEAQDQGEGEALDASISAPQNGSSVGPTFRVTGRANPTCNIGNGSRIVDSAGNDVNLAQGDANLVQQGNQFTFTVDLNKPLNRGNGGPDTRLIREGELTIIVSAINCFGEAVTRVNYQKSASQGQPRQNAAVAVSPSLSPSPSPSVAPLNTATPEANTAGSTSFPDWAWVVIGALGGAAVLGGAEYSAHKYHQKHSKRKA